MVMVSSAGNLQLGIPPETIKDTMQIEGGVPRTFIVPKAMFDVQHGVALAEMEFPVYYNFFFRKDKTRIVCSVKQRRRIEAVMAEALFGPEEVDPVGEFTDGENTPGFTDLKTEMSYFRKSMSETGRVELGDLIEFCVPDRRGKAVFGATEVRFDHHGNIRIYDQGKRIAAIGRDAPVMARKSSLPRISLDFQPPVFGVTTLGAGHGFDPNADTSGLILWVNHRGIMVDPPVNSTEKLAALGVSPKWIDKIILTHCHADHDAGTLQKIFQEGKIHLFTTRTIYGSFMRKAEALTGIEAGRLARLVDFYPVCIGKPEIIGGGIFHFHYTLHSIPTIAIQASLAGKSLVYSSDTMNDPQFIDRLYAEGVLTKNRRDFLQNFPWDRDLVFHEAGIPPIHTPMSYLCSLPEDVRKRMYLVHVNPDSVPEGCDLRIAPTGLSNTVDLGVSPMPREEAVEMLDAFSSVEWFGQLPLEKAREFLLAARVTRYRASDIIFSKGDAGDAFYMVMSGEIEIVLDDRILTTYDAGGYFGEKSLFSDEKRTATARAKTDVKLLSIRKEEMLSLIRGTAAAILLRRIADFQNVELRDALMNNPILGSLSSTQQTRLHGLIRPFPHALQSGDVIAPRGSAAGCAYLIREGSIDVYHRRSRIATLFGGDLFGVRKIFRPKEKKNFLFVAREKTALYCIEPDGLNRYLEDNPGVYVKMYHSSY
jgi:CRP-like cAMP-binding protein